MSSNKPSPLVEYCGIVNVSGSQGPAERQIVFPDVHGCIARGETLEDLLRNARGALVRHFEDLKAKGQSIPPPSSRQTIEACASGYGEVASVGLGRYRLSKGRKSSL